MLCVLMVRRKARTVAGCGDYPAADGRGGVRADGSGRRARSVAGRNNRPVGLNGRGGVRDDGCRHVALITNEVSP
jgi:hypothetical protein